jgi:hypothetical protein
MNGEIKLKFPLLINGENRRTLSYDTDEITSLQFLEAETKKMQAKGVSGGGNMAGAAEIDYGLHLYLGFAAILVINPDLDYKDLERLIGGALNEVMKIGRNFFLTESEETSEESISGEQSGTTPGTFIPPSDTSNPNDLESS